MESDSDDGRPAKADTPGTQPGGKLRVERDQAVDWPQLVRHCDMLGVVDSFTPSIEEQLAALDRAKKSDRSKQTRKENLRQCH